MTLQITTIELLPPLQIVLIKDVMGNEDWISAFLAPTFITRPYDLESSVALPPGRCEVPKVMH